MSERDTGSGRTGGGEDLEARAENAKSGVATLVCALGLVIALGSAVATIFVGVGVDVISGGAIGVGLGILGYFLGAGRLGVATIVVSILAMFAGLLVNQVIPGVGGDDRELPAREPGSSEG
ncbi:hypothetical protein GBA65_00280 [Rubrobacter marinus]|uniref:Uncharacterized protein n=1 Tax=Rubrobacter marinus TaxID=2653852 RepID=A0A6G8PU45_9ACTN|nr:hypothetical protein [Rubrobacter marinus]QIN77205.1 hypothetical protein GBA65_00280 [Rubrobacter marinus]